MTILLFANGDLAAVDWVRPYLEKASVIIAADGGAGHLMNLGHPPDIVIGDMDSLVPTTRRWLEEAGSQFIVHPREKDETDLELALVYAAGHHQGEICLFATLGGRLDQTLANIMLLAHPSLQSHKVRLVNEHENAWLVVSNTEIHGAKGDTVSLIPLGGNVEIEITTGLQWQLKQETLAFGAARGTSNVMTADLATVSVNSGALLCIHTQQSWKR